MKNTWSIRHHLLYDLHIPYILSITNMTPMFRALTLKWCSISELDKIKIFLLTVSLTNYAKISANKHFNIK